MATTAQPHGSPTDPQATLPPHSIESEQAILGAIILSEKAHYAYVVEEEITAADFYRARHRVIFEALLGLFDRGSEIDVLSVTEELKSVGKLEEAGGEEAIQALVTAVPAVGNLRRYAEANGTQAGPVSGKPRVLFYGDSITDGWRLNEYFPERDYVNRGISGQITGEMLGRMQADVIAHRPQAMLILAGTNDIARGVAVGTIQNNLTMIADLCEFHKIKVILASILPVSDHHKAVNPRFEMTKGRPPAVIRELNTWMAAFAKKRGFTYLNYYDSMVDSGGFLKAELADDGLHPNSAGYRVMAPLAQVAIDETVVATISQQKSGKKRQK